MKKLTPFVQSIQPSRCPSVWRRAMRAALTLWHCQSTRLTPPQCETLCDGPVPHTQVGSPFRFSFSHIAQRIIGIISAIAVLLFICCPTYITRLVMSVNVNAVKSMFRCWFTPDFSKKFFKGCKPKFNTSSAISVIGVISGIGTSAFRRLKATQFGRRAFVTSFAVRNKRFANAVTTITPARLRVTASEITGRGVRDIRAVTPALPKTFTICRPDIRNYSQATKPLTCQIHEIMDGWKRSFHNPYCITLEAAWV